MSNITHQYAQDARNPLGAGRNGLDAISITLAIGEDNLADGDLWRFIKLQAGTFIDRAILQCDDLDSGTAALEVDVGVNYSGVLTDDPDALIDGSTAGQAGGATLGTTSLLLLEEATIQAEVITSADAAQAGNATLTLFIANADHPNV